MSTAAAGRFAAPRTHSHTGPIQRHLWAPAPALVPCSKRKDGTARITQPTLCAASSGAATFDGGDGRVGTVDFMGGNGAAGNQGGGLLGLLVRWNARAKDLRQRINDLGLAGVASYGLFNTLYYISAFLFIWFFVTRVERGQGLPATARKVTEVLALTWAGSQVTKLARAGAALAMAPAVDRGLDLIKARLGLATKVTALVVLTVGCVALALFVFGSVLLLSA